MYHLLYTSSCEERVSGSIWTKNKCFWVVVHGFDTCNNFVWQAIEMKNVEHSTPVDTSKTLEKSANTMEAFLLAILIASIIDHIR